MSVYVGWMCEGYVQVFHELTEETTSHKVTEVRSDLSTMDTALDELQAIVNVDDVKQLVFIRDDDCIEVCESIVGKLTARGFKSFYVQPSLSNEVQALLLQLDTEFVEGQVFLTAIKDIDDDGEASTVWYYSNGQVKFVSVGPVIPSSTTDLSAYYDKISQLFDDYDITLMINRKCTQVVRIVNTLYPECIIVNQSTYFDDHNFGKTALWTAKRRGGLVDGLEVCSFCWTELKLRIGANSPSYYDPVYVPLPFNWIFDWKCYKFARTASATFDELNFDLKLPPNRRCRFNIKIDINGSPRIFVELECILGISLSQDSFYLARSPDSMDGKVVSVGQFPTALRFDCNPPKLTAAVSGDNVIADAIKMLDPEQEPNNGWKRIRTLEENEFCKLHRNDSDTKVVTSAYVVSELFNDVRSLVSDACVDAQGPICVALSRSFTQKQQEKLRNILKSKQPQIIFFDEILAATYGYSVENGREDGVTLVVDLSTTGCQFSLLRIKNKCCEQIVQREFAELKSENIRQAMRDIFSSHDSAVELRSEFDAEMSNVVTQFRQAIFDVVGVEQVNVKNVLLVGSCHLLPKLKEFLVWSFFQANMFFLKESELSRLAAAGSILLHLQSLTTPPPVYCIDD